MKKAGQTKCDVIRYTAAKRIVQNVNGVPKRQWGRWTPAQRMTFNTLYEQMEEQEFFRHADGTNMPSVRWNVTRWNAAYTAADNYGTIRAIEEDLT